MLCPFPGQDRTWLLIQGPKNPKLIKAHVAASGETEAIRGLWG